MTKILLIIPLLILSACGDDNYKTLNYTQRLDSLDATIHQTQNELKALKADILAIIDDSVKIVNWDEKITTFIGQPKVLDYNLRSISTILFIQADSLPFFVADTTNPRYLRNYSETRNTSKLLAHGLNTVIASNLIWFDKIFTDTLMNSKVKRRPYVNTNRLMNLLNKKEKQLKSVGDFEIFRLQILSEANLIVKNLLIEYKEIWRELKNSNTADASTFKNINVPSRHRRKHYGGWVMLSDLYKVG